MEGKWSSLSLASFVIGVFCFFKFMYFDLAFAMLTIFFASKGFLIDKSRHIYLILIGAGAFLFVIAAFQLLVRTRELGYLPPLF